MGVAEVGPLVMRDPAIRALDWDLRFALFALMTAAGPKARFVWDATTLAQIALPDDDGAAILFARLLPEIESQGIARQYDVGGTLYGEVILPILITSYMVGYRRSNRGARYPAPLESRPLNPVQADVQWELEFQLFWGAYQHHDNRDKAKAAWCALRKAGVAVEAIERAHTAYRLTCYQAVADNREFARIGCSAFLSEAWVNYLEAGI